MSAFHTARQEKERFDQLVITERCTAEAQARKDLEELRAALTALGQEEKAISEGQQQKRQAIHTEFRRKADVLETESKHLIGTLDAEARQVESTKQTDLSNARQDYLLQLIAFINENTPHISDDQVVDQIDPQARLQEAEAPEAGAA